MIFLVIVGVAVLLLFKAWHFAFGIIPVALAFWIIAHTEHGFDEKTVTLLIVGAAIGLAKRGW